jgi:hypothetical protein
MGGGARGAPAGAPRAGGPPPPPPPPPWAVRYGEAVGLGESAGPLPNPPPQAGEGARRARGGFGASHHSGMTERTARQRDAGAPYDLNCGFLFALNAAIPSL